MTMHHLGDTDSFTVFFDDVGSSAERRAGAVLDTCEHDFRILRDWFGVHDGFGAGDRVRVIVTPGAFPEFGGDSTTYQPAHTTLTLGSFESAPSQPLGDESTQAMLVRELSKVLMDYRNQRDGRITWTPEGGDGIALSMACHEALRPDIDAPPGWSYALVDWWSSGGRPDWISTAATEYDGQAIGCSRLFISYLISQLGHSIDQVIQRAGSTLEETYATLTGMSGGYAALTGLLSRFYPDDANLGTDDPFPLLDASSRTVSLSVRVAEIGRTPAGEVDVAVPLPFPCQGEQQCHFQLFDLDLLIEIDAYPRGFANPTFAWTVGGIELPSDGGGFVAEATAWPAVPGRPVGEPMGASMREVGIEVWPYATGPARRDPLPINSLAFQVDSVGEQLMLVVRCTVTDQVSPGVTDVTNLVELDTRAVVVDEGSAEEIRACRERAIKVIGDRFTANPLLRIMPDPPPDFIRAITALRVLTDERQAAIEKGDKEWADQLGSLLADRLGFAPVEARRGAEDSHQPP